MKINNRLLVFFLFNVVSVGIIQSQTNEYLSFFHWTNGQLSATNWQSDSDPVYFGAIGSKNGCVFADVTITNSGAWNASGGPHPRYGYNNSGMPATAGFGMRLDADWTNVNQQIVYTITFKDGNAGPISEFLTTFSIYDINAHVCGATAANRFIDEVQVIGYRANLITTVNPNLTPAINSGGILCNDNQITGNVIKGSSDCGFSRLNVDFGTTPVARVQIIYRSGTGHPANQNCGTNPNQLILGDNPRSQFILLSAFAVTGGCVNLPVEFNQFNATCNESQAFLNWSTYTELDNDYFTIERSTDGFNFEKLTDVVGGGTVNYYSDYKWVDERPLPGVSYYRLSQTDYDGTHTVLKTISFDHQCAVNAYSLSVHPNPISDQSLVRLELNVQSTVQLALFDNSGRLMKEVLGTTLMEAGLVELNFDAENLASGIYLLTLMINGELETVKIVK